MQINGMSGLSASRFCEGGGYEQNPSPLERYFHAVAFWPVECDRFLDRPGTCERAVMSEDPEGAAEFVGLSMEQMKAGAAS